MTLSYRLDDIEEQCNSLVTHFLSQIRTLDPVQRPERFCSYYRTWKQLTDLRDKVKELRDASDQAALAALRQRPVIAGHDAYRPPIWRLR